MRERDIEKHFVETVEDLGGLTRKVQWIGRRGCPDRYAVFPGGRYCWVELKAPGQWLDPHQEREIARLVAMGIKVAILSSVQDVDAWAEEYR